MKTIVECLHDLSPENLDHSALINLEGEVIAFEGKAPSFDWAVLARTLVEIAVGTKASAQSLGLSLPPFNGQGTRPYIFLRVGVDDRWLAMMHITGTYWLACVHHGVRMYWHAIMTATVGDLEKLLMNGVEK